MWGLYTPYFSLSPHSLPSPLPWCGLHKPSKLRSFRESASVLGRPSAPFSPYTSRCVASVAARQVDILDICVLTFTGTVSAFTAGDLCILQGVHSLVLSALCMYRLLSSVICTFVHQCSLVFFLAHHYLVLEAFQSSFSSHVFRSLRG